MKSYRSVISYLDSFINYEKKSNFSYKKLLKLQRVKNLFTALNIDYEKLNIVHIAGTKGKGSTAHFCASLLGAAGMKVGLYTSPHFFDVRERIKIVKRKDQEIKASKISKKSLIEIVSGIKPKVDMVKKDKELGSVSFFELYTAIAFEYFLKEGVNFAVLETGMGGRLDATNIVKPRVCILTHIDLDHTQQLGKSLEKIAYEKAGIIKSGVPVVTTYQKDRAITQIKKKCRSVKAPLYILGRDFSIGNVRIRPTHTTFDFSFNRVKLRNLRINLKGKYQVENAACALVSFFILKDEGFIKKKDNAKLALIKASIEGRFDIEKKDPLIITDIAHNPSSFTALDAALKYYFPKKKVILVFAASSDKDIRSMLQKINFSDIIFTTFSNPRALKPEGLKVKANIKQALVAKNIKEALRLAKGLYSKNHLILISGSLFLVAEAKKYLKRVN